MPIIPVWWIPTRRFRHGDTGYVAEHQALLTPLQDFLQKCPNVSYLCPAEVVKPSMSQLGGD